MNNPRSVLIIAGPTASGKSALAMDVAREFTREITGTIINADSMQVYRELRIITARPSAADEAEIPHRLYGMLSAADVCSAGHWLRLAVAEIEMAHAAGSLPIVVGGTGLYLNALLEGIVDIPDIPADIRNDVRALHEQLGGEQFREELTKLDPASAEKIPASDPQRLIRAYEVAQATGRSLSDWQKQTPKAPLAEWDQETILVSPPRDTLYEAIDQRFERMLEAGVLEEVKALAALGLPPDRPAMKALGIPDLIAHFEGKISLNQAVSKAQQASRNYAKRQLTWFRNQLEQNYTHSAQYSESHRGKIFSFICNFLLTPSS
jgi:tRNA dimethylallyltransferase